MTADSNQSRTDIETTTLPNGVRVITEAMPHVRSVSVGIWIGTGSRRETPEQNGISHFIEHMLFKGTTNRSAEDIARSVDSIGGNLDAFTAKELVCFNTKVLDEHLPLAFDVLADLVLQSAVPRRGHREGKGRHSRRDQDGGGQSGLPGPRDLLLQFLEGSSAGQADSGHPRDGQAFRPRDVRDYYSRRLRARRTC